MTATNVLLVEDEDLNRALVRAILARTSDPVLREIDLVEAPTLTAARDILANHPVDVVLLDLNLPDGHGLSLASDLSSGVIGDGSAARPEIIALTASVLPQERAAAIEAGCDGFLDKPYVAADLVTILSRHIERRRA